MANSSQTLKEQLEALARDTHERLAEARVLHVRFGEETLTDLLLLEIKRQKRVGSQIVQTSPHKEKLSGTDWEWWIGSPRVGWVRYAVQAKKADKTTGRYNSLTHKVNGRPQIDLLERYARGADAIPIYCFYNYPFPDTSTVHWQCCSTAFDVNQLACTVAPIDTVRDAINTRGCKSFDWLHRKQGVVPWRCLAHCPRMRRGQRSNGPSPGGLTSHPLGGEEVRIFSSLPPEIEEARAMAGPPGDGFVEIQLEHCRKACPNRILILETSEQDEIVRD